MYGGRRNGGVRRNRTLDIAVIDVPTLRLDHRADRQRLVETVQCVSPRLVVLDPLVRLHAVAEVAPMLGFLRDIQRRFETAVLLVHRVRTRRGLVARVPWAEVRARVRPAAVRRGVGPMAVAARKYNAGFLLIDELVATFCVRAVECESLIEALRDCSGSAAGPLSAGRSRGATLDACR